MLFERLSTPRPAPKIVLESAWQSQQHQRQQQQQDTSESASSRTGKLMQRVQREEQGQRIKVTQQRTQNYPAPGNWSGVLCQLLKKEKRELKIDLRIEGITQDVVLKDEERIGQIKHILENGEMAVARYLFGKIW